jgi:hypothetical protein
MSYRAVALALVFVSGAFAQPASAGEPRAVIELFTSQGCSSCPPADKLLGQLAHDPSIIALSLPVDYWDYLGWKDTLALHDHSTRQKEYAEARGDRAVYTPQVVVNGIVHVLGSDKAAIEKAIAATRGELAPLSLPVSVEIAEGKLTVKVAARDGVVGPAEVYLCPFASKIPVTVQRGENGGKTLTYYDVVRRWVKLGAWSGKAETFSLPLSEVTNGESDVDHVAVLVQREQHDRPGLVLGAAEAKLK